MLIYDEKSDLISVQMVESVRTLLREKGLTVTSVDLSGREAQYCEAIDNAVRDGAGGIVLALRYSPKADESAEAAMAQGVKVFQLGGKYYGSTVCFSANEYDVGYDTGRLIAEKLQKKTSKPRITIITIKDLRSVEKGFEDGLRELLPDAVIRYRIQSDNDDEEVAPDQISSRYFSDAIVDFFCDNVKMPMLGERPLVVYAGILPPSFHPDYLNKLSAGEALKSAVDQFVNAVSGKRVDEKEFFYVSTLE